MNRSSDWFVLLLGLLVALGAHVLLGWEWTLVGGIATGFMASKRPLLLASAACGLSWLILLGWNLAVAHEPVFRMLSTMGGMFGGLPGWGIGVLTKLVGALLGLGGALAGYAFRKMLLERGALLRRSVA